jgi:hypothetical protein
MFGSRLRSRQELVLLRWKSESDRYHRTLHILNQLPQELERFLFGLELERFALWRFESILGPGIHGNHCYLQQVELTPQSLL